MKKEMINGNETDHGIKRFAYSQALSKVLQSAKESYIQLSDQGINKDILAPFDQLIKESESIIQREAEYRKKQISGIQTARNNGVHLGRPAIPCSQNFLRLAYQQSTKKITAIEAAEKLGIGLSTFYKLKRRCREELEQWKHQET